MKNFEIYSSLNRWNRTHEFWNKCVVPFTIAKLGQKCLEAAPKLKHEPLNSCITVLSVWMHEDIFKNDILSNTLSSNKRQKNCEEPRFSGLKVPLFDLLAMSCLDAKISLVPNFNLQYLQTYWPIQHKSEHKLYSPVVGSSSLFFVGGRRGCLI